MISFETTTTQLSFKSIKFLLQLVLIFLATNIYGQITDFPFDNNFNDVVEGYTPTAFGNPTIITDNGNQVIQLEGDEYLRFPEELTENIDPDQDVEIQIRFKVTDTYVDTPYAGTGEFGDNGKRILVSNKTNDIFEKGFDVFVSQMGDEYRILMSFGDNTISGGTFIFNDLIAENEWTELKLILRLNNERPSIVYKLNGYYQHFSLAYLDVDEFKESLNTQQIWVGTDAENLQDSGNYAYAETSIDYIKIFNPTFVGDVSEVTNSLNNLKNHLIGTAPLSPIQQKNEMENIVANWDDNTYAEITSDVLDYIETYENEVGTVFEFYTDYVDIKEVEIPRALQFILLQWMIDNLYTSDNVANMEGISFLDHEIMPGVVSPDAPRITETIAIDGDYNTNPGYFLNTSIFVIRPTGFYAAPGELVTINFPPEVVNQGVKIHVGAHFVDLREDWRGFRRFPTSATIFEVNNETMTIANPLGGALYVTFPDGSNFGSVSLQIENAVKSPYYSTKTGFENNLADYQTDFNNNYVNWVDIESDNFMCTFPIALASLAPDMDDVLTTWNTMIEQFNVIGGRPLTRIRSEYVISEPQIYTQGTYPASYPMSIPNGDLGESDIEAVPVSVLTPEFFMSSYDGTTILHELGHLHNFPTMEDEYETNVNLMAVLAFETAFGVSIDTGLYYTNNSQMLVGDLSALDWILDPRFRKFETTTYEEVAYQSRGVAKYVDVARIFSWDTVGLIHNFWYQEQLDTNEPAESGIYVSADEYIEVASNQLGVNFAPLWEVWGSSPSEDMFNQLDDYEKEFRIMDRILYYRSLVPANAAEFQVIYNDLTPNVEEHHKIRYDQMLTYYDESVADSIYVRIDDILCKYFDVNCDPLNVDGLSAQSSIQLLPNPTDNICEMTGLKKGYKITLMSVNGEVIQKIDCSATSYVLDITRLSSGLYLAEIRDEKGIRIGLKKLVKN